MPWESICDNVANRSAHGRRDSCSLEKSNENIEFGSGSGGGDNVPSPVDSRRHHHDDDPRSSVFARQLGYVKGNGSNFASASASRGIGTGVTGDTQVSTAIRAAGATSFTYEVYHFKTDTPFDPKLLGTLQTIQWELWYKVVPGPGGSIAPSSYGELWIAAKQGDGIYLSGPSRRDPVNSVSNWQKSSGVVGANTFGLALGSGPPVLNVGPTAGRIYFGYLNSSGVFLPTPQVDYRVSFLDLKLTSEVIVAEPSSASLVLIASVVPYLIKRAD